MLHPPRIPVTVVPARRVAHAVALLACLLIACTLSKAEAAPLPATVVPVVADVAASDAFLAKAAATSRWYVNDLEKGETGTLYDAATPEKMTTGRYRLRGELAMAPLGDLMVSGIAVKLSAGDESLSLDMVQFPRAGEFIPVALDFTVSRGGSVPLAVTWSFTGDQAKKNRNLAMAKAGATEPTNTLDTDTIDLDLLSDGTKDAAEATTIPYRIMGRGFHVEPLSPVRIADIRTAKLRYVPGEKGTYTVILANDGPSDATVAVHLTMRWGLDGERDLGTRDITVPAGKTAKLDGDFSTEDRHWGVELEASVTVAALPPESAAAVCVVSRSMWENAVIGAHPAHMAYFDNPADARKAVRKLRDSGFTGFEAFFWGPCDMLDFTPDTERFYGGQGGYPGSITGTRNLIQACHDEGLDATFYANLWGASGTPAFDLMRQHPEWFGNGAFQTWVLDDWDLFGPSQADMRDSKIRAPGIFWNHSQIHGDIPVDLMEYHAKEINGSIDMFKWDGIRYDSFYSRQWTVESLRLVRDRVNGAHPDFGFAYNSFAMNDYAAMALDTMIGGGGMVMAEGIRIERVPNLAAYANELLTWQDTVWSYGGHLGPLYHDKFDEVELTSLDTHYIPSIYLATGSHPYYTPLPPTYSQACLRFGEFIYDNDLRLLRDPASVVQWSPGVAERLLDWPRMARTRTLPNGRHRLVLHALNIPGQHAPISDKAMQASQPLAGASVTLTLPPGAKATGAWALQAWPQVRRLTLTPHVEGAQVRVELPETRFWTAIVLEFDGPEGLPIAATAKDRTDSLLRDWYVIGPFPSDATGSGNTVAYPPETGVDVAATVPVEGREPLAWQRSQPPADKVPGPYSVDFAGIFPASASHSPGIAYAWRTVESDRERDVLVLGGGDDGLSVWINGESVIAKPKLGDVRFDNAQGTAHLKEGTNTILVKVGQTDGYWSFVLRLADPVDRSPVRDGLTLDMEGPR